MFNQTVPDWLIGVWKRLSIEENGIRDTTTQATWVQARSGFADIRIPANRAYQPIVRYSQSISHNQSINSENCKRAEKQNTSDLLASLISQQAVVLSQQEGFAGITQFVDGLCEWQRALDYAPFTGELDRGTLHWEGDILIETGPNQAYKEEWQQIATGPTATMTATNGLAWEKWLVICDDYFIYMCDRRQQLPANTTLKDLLNFNADGKLSINSQQYLNCEVSLGRIQAKDLAWEIQQSTLPWKEGKPLWNIQDFSIDRNSNKAVQLAGEHQTVWDIQEWGHLQQVLAPQMVGA